MKSIEKRFAVRALSLAVQGALITMSAVPLAAKADDAANDEVKALILPRNFIEVGAFDVSRDSAKFGEYNGLYEGGLHFIGTVGLRGGDAYGMGSGTRRWEVTGSDLGTSSTTVGASIGDQGKWGLGIGYDQLRHNITDSYQTPFLGSMGGNTFTLPTSFGVINTAGGTPPSGNKAGTDFLTANQKASFQSKDVHSDRENTTFNAKYVFDNQWDVKFDYNHLVQSGAKLLGVAGDQINSPISPTSTLTWAGQTPLVLMNPTNYTTNTFNLALNWVGDQAHISASYFGSLFRDGYDGLSWNNPFTKTAIGTAPTGTVPTAFGLDTISTMPSNDFHQLNLSGGYAFNSATKLAGGLSYGRNTQDAAYGSTGSVGLMQAGGLPKSSLNGLVVTTHADLKLTNQTTKDLALSAGIKYNERDNKTESNTYAFNHINGTGGVGGTANETALNAPMSNKKTQLELAGDYRIDKEQKLRLSYEFEKIKRWCNNAAANNGPSNFGNLAYWGGTAYVPQTCAEVPESKENKLAANYRRKVNEAVSFSAGYGYSQRKVDVNTSFYNPMQVDPEGFEVPGFRSFFQGSRKQQLLKGGVNWQANEKLTLGLNGRVTDDTYEDLTYGVKDGKSWSLNLDATYALGEQGSVSAFLTSQNSKRDMTNLQGVTQTNASNTTLKVPVGATWSNRLKEDDTTFGLNAKQGGLMGGKLDIGADLTYSFGKTGYATDFNYADGMTSGTTAGLTCAAANFLTCGSLPSIQNKMLQLKLAGGYQVDKANKVGLGFIYQRLISNDYFYNTYQVGSTPSTLLPTNQQAPNYKVNVLFASFNHSF